MSEKFSALLSELKKTIPQITVSEAKAALPSVAQGKLAFIDVRDEDEVSQGTVPGSLHLPRAFLEMRVEDEVPEKSTELLLFCAAGTRSLLAADTLKKLGYSRVKSITGGFNEWKSAGLPVETPRRLSDSAKKRYSRHTIIPEIGEAGQLKLLDSKVLLIGAGGLGSPAAYYLAAAGVGTLGIIDFDRVEESNLQRQILHTPARVGKLKVESARETLEAFNPLVKVNAIAERLTLANAKPILSQYDMIVDGCDNFQTRYLVNDTCVSLGKICVHGSVFRFEGQVSVFDSAAGGPCYRCLFPEPPPSAFAPSCAEAGVLGVLPGVIGLLEATEAIKALLGIGERLVGRLVKYDALNGGFDVFKVKKDPACKCCVQHLDLSATYLPAGYCEAIASPSRT